MIDGDVPWDEAGVAREALAELGYCNPGQGHIVRSLTHRESHRRSATSPGGSCHPSPPGPTALAAARPPGSPASSGWDRSSSTRSRSPAATTTSSCSPGSPATGASGPTASCTTSGALYETYNKGLSLVPTAELPWYRVDLGPDHGSAHDGETFDEHAPLVEELLERIRRDGADVVHRHRAAGGDRVVLAADEPGPGDPRGARPRPGILGLARRDGNRRVYDLVERLFPAELLAQAVPTREQLPPQAPVALPGARPARARRARGAVARDVSAVERRRRRRAAARGRRRRELHAELVADGVARAGRRRRDPRAALSSRPRSCRCSSRRSARSPPDRRRAAPPPASRSSPPLDPLVWDRDFLRSLYGFDYVWEVYVPRRSDAGATTCCRSSSAIDSSAGSSRGSSARPARCGSLGLWWEDGFDPLAEPGFVAGFGDAIEAHRAFGGVERISWPPTARHRAFARAVRAAR